MVQNHNTPVVYKPEDLTLLLGLSRNTVYEMLRSGRIRSVRVGTRYLIPYSALEAFLCIENAESQEK